jgi:TolB-like protein
MMVETLQSSYTRTRLTNLWSERYDRPDEDIFAVQSNAPISVEASTTTAAPNRTLSAYSAVYRRAGVAA